jgi:hypothetical protein
VPEPSVMLSELGDPFETCHKRVEVCPGAIVFGLAVRARVKGTVTVAVCGPTLPAGPVAVRENVVLELIGTTAEPDVGKAVVSSVSATAGVIVTDVAF